MYDNFNQKNSFSKNIYNLFSKNIYMSYSDFYNQNLYLQEILEKSKTMA